VCVSGELKEKWGEMGCCAGWRRKRRERGKKRRKGEGESIRVTCGLKGDERERKKEKRKRMDKGSHVSPCVWLGEDRVIFS
jgi:hypothetical protein